MAKLSMVILGGLAGSGPVRPSGPLAGGPKIFIKISKLIFIKISGCFQIYFIFFKTFYLVNL
jgi:hypothetical protein